MSVVVFRKNLMTDGGPAKAHTIGRVSAERGAEQWTVQVDHHESVEQAQQQTGVVWQTYYEMPFDADLGECPFDSAASWLTQNESKFTGSEIVESEAIDSDLSEEETQS